VRVLAAPFIPVEEVRAIVNGKSARTWSVEDDTTRDPFGTTGLLRFDARIELRELAKPGQDAWLVMEAGLPFPVTGDLEDSDGLPDTTDNNGDGRVDAKDGIGDFHEPGPVPENGPRFHVQAIAPGTLPHAFTNPFLIDWDGDGWQAPGLP
jgi:hypothetical protein